MKKKPTHGGPRKGAGRPPAADPKVKIWVSVKKSKADQAREIIREVVDRINAE
jgi:hypothetical protein